MANLPPFNAFGLTVTQFMPLLEAVPMACHAEPTAAFDPNQLFTAPTKAATIPASDTIPTKTPLRDSGFLEVSTT